MRWTAPTILDLTSLKRVGTAMERYFFHVEYGEHFHDVSGTLLPTPAAARSAAVSLLGEMLRDEGDRFWSKPDVIVTVTDASGLTLWTLTAYGRESGAVSLSKG